MLTYQSITRKASHLSYCSDIHPDLGRTAGSREREREREESSSPAALILVISYGAC